MARVNVDDDVEAKEEFWKLLAIVGDRDAAIGKLVRFFRLCQSRYGRNESVTEDEINEAGLHCMITSGWAVPQKGGYQSKGADKYFSWYAQKKLAAVLGGKARANAPRDEHGRFQPGASHEPAEVQPDASRDQPPSSPLALALAPAPVKKDKYSVYSPEFESIWKIHPEGSKQEASKRFEEHVGKEKSETFLTAIKIYLAECRKKNRFAKDLSTFIGTGNKRSIHYWLFPPLSALIFEYDCGKIAGSWCVI